jgi:hypothetical protein
VRGSKPSLSDRFTRWQFRQGEHLTFAGVRVVIHWPTDQERDVFFPKLEAAIALLEHTAPKYLARLRHNADGVLALPVMDALGQWESAVRLVGVNQDWIMAPATQPEDIALTLVHESTHAWLAKLGIEYAEPVRARVEAICFKAELRVAARLPNSERLIATLNRQLARDPAYWTTEAFRKRAYEQLRSLGFPRWVISALKQLARLVPQN